MRLAKADGDDERSTEDTTSLGFNDGVSLEDADGICEGSTEDTTSPLGFNDGV